VDWVPLETMQRKEEIQVGLEQDEARGQQLKVCSLLVFTADIDSGPLRGEKIQWEYHQ
jgi:hypothetical protein